MRIAMALLTVSLAFGSACKKDKKPEPSAGSAAGSAQTTGSAAGSADSAGSAAGSAGSEAGSADSAGSGAAATTPMQNKGGNCPSLVSGATTKAELKDGKVILTISAGDKNAIAAIQKRTEELLKAKSGGGDGSGSGSGDGGGGGTAHDQKGTHGGGMGLCPVHVQEGGKAEAQNDASGVVITLTPANNADAYKAEIDSRITKAAEWAKANVPEGDKGTTGGVGGGKGEHGMNHSGQGDGKGQERKGDGKGGGKGTGGGGGMGTGGGGGMGTGGGDGKGGEKSK